MGGYTPYQSAGAAAVVSAAATSKVGCHIVILAQGLSHNAARVLGCARPVCPNRAHLDLNCTSERAHVSRSLARLAAASDLSAGQSSNWGLHQVIGAGTRVQAQSRNDSHVFPPVSYTHLTLPTIYSV